MMQMGQAVKRAGYNDVVDTVKIQTKEHDSPPCTLYTEKAMFSIFTER